MLHKAWNSKGEMPYCFHRLSIKFQGHTGQNTTDFDPNWAFPDYRPVAAFKSLRFPCFCLSVSNITENHINGFDKIFRLGLKIAQGTINCSGLCSECFLFPMFIMSFLWTPRYDNTLIPVIFPQPYNPDASELRTKQEMMRLSATNCIKVCLNIAIIMWMKLAILSRTDV